MRTVRPSVVSAVGVALSIAMLGLGAGAEPGTRGTDRVRVPGGYYTNVSLALLQQMLARKDFLLINVHVPYEGELPGTDLLIPFDEVELRTKLLPRDQGAKILLYCRSGNMSDTAARTLVRLGYRNVWHFPGGMNAWKAAGFALIQKDQK
jgi:rhodanese-related sulfurtransferase